MGTNITPRKNGLHRYFLAMQRALYDNNLTLMVRSPNRLPSLLILLWIFCIENGLYINIAKAEAQLVNC